MDSSIDDFLNSPSFWQLRKVSLQDRVLELSSLRVVDCDYCNRLITLEEDQPKSKKAKHSRTEGCIEFRKVTCRKIREILENHDSEASPVSGSEEFLDQLEGTFSALDSDSLAKFIERLQRIQAQKARDASTNAHESATLCPKGLLGSRGF